MRAIAVIDDLLATGGTAAAAGRLVRRLGGTVAGYVFQSTEVRVGVAPVDAANGLSFVLVAAVGALTIVLDHVVLTARMPLLAGVKSAKMRAVVEPGEKLDVTAELVHDGSGFAMTKANVCVW